MDRNERRHAYANRVNAMVRQACLLSAEINKIYDDMLHEAKSEDWRAVEVSRRYLDRTVSPMTQVLQAMHQAHNILQSNPIT